ncbi:S-layer homology domain-containing protein [Bacillus sp. JJ722]|uniref:S-layer homology domain-containing protein n=1 Tax=Bacillus sp. JJ722 TaxID=3122973 RepID=UPI002FFE5C22
MTNQSKRNNRFIALSVSATLVATAVAPVGASAFSDVGPSYKNAVDYLKSKGVKGLSSKTFGVYQNIKRVDAAVMFAKSLGLNIYAAPPSGFTDVPARAEPYVNVLKAVGIVQGTSKTKFNSNSLISRGEIALMLQRAYNLEGTSTTPFTDVTPFYSSAVSALYDYGITTGVSATQFGTSHPVKRGDFANFLYRASKVAKYDPNNPYVPGKPTKFGISSAKYISKTEVEVTFSKPIDNVKVPQFVVQGTRVTAAKLASDKRTVTLKVTPMDYNKTYTVIAEGITVNKETQPTVRASFKSEATPPALAISSVKFNKLTEVEVTLNKPVDSVKVDQFSIDGVKVKSARLNSDKRRVTLTLENLQYSRSYRINVDGVTINKEVQPAFSYTFTTPAAPNGAAITGVKFINLTQIELTFAKPIDSVKPTNFIMDNVTVKSAKLSSDKLKVVLTLDVLQYSKTYSIKADGLTVNKEKQAPSTYYFATPVAPPGATIDTVKVLNMKEVELTFSSDIDPVKTTNFSIEGLKVRSAKSTGKRTVLLTLDGMNYNTVYNIKADGITVNKAKQPLTTRSFVSPTAPASAILTIVEAKMIRSNEIEVRFNKSVDSVKETNFNIPGQVVKSAKVQSDKRKVVVTTLDPLEYGGKLYTIKALGITVNKELQSTATKDFVSPNSPIGGFLAISNVKYLSQNTLEVELSTEVDSVRPTNFTIEGKRVTGAKLDQDKRTVTLTVSNLDFSTEYNLTAEGIRVNKDIHPTTSKTFTTPAINEVWGIRVSTQESVKLPDNSTERLVTFELINKITKTVDTKANGILLEISTSEGNFDKRQVTISKGTASAKLKVPPISEDKTAKVTVRVVDTPIAYEMLKEQTEQIDIPLYSTTDATPFYVKSIGGKRQYNSDKEDIVSITFSESYDPREINDLGNFILNNEKLHKTFVTEEGDVIKGAKLEFRDIDNNTANGTEILDIILPEGKLNDGINTLEILPNFKSKDQTMLTGDMILSFSTKLTIANKLNESGLHTFTGVLEIEPQEQVESYGPTTGGPSIIQGDVEFVNTGNIKTNEIKLNNITFEQNVTIASPVLKLVFGDKVKFDENKDSRLILNWSDIGTSANSRTVENNGQLNNVYIENKGLIQDGITIENKNNGKIKNITINTGGTVTLKGDEFENVYVKNGSKLIIEGHAKNVEVDGGSTVEMSNNGKADVIKTISFANSADATVRVNGTGAVGTVQVNASHSTIEGTGSVDTIQMIAPSSTVNLKGKAKTLETSVANSIVNLDGSLDTLIAKLNSTVALSGNGQITKIYEEVPGLVTVNNPNFPAPEPIPTP